MRPRSDAEQTSGFSITLYSESLLSTRQWCQAAPEAISYPADCGGPRASLIYVNVGIGDATVTMDPESGSEVIQRPKTEFDLIMALLQPFGQDRPKGKNIDKEHWKALSRR